MVYGDLKALLRGNAFDKSLHDNALEMASNPQYEEYLGGLTSHSHRKRGDRVAAALTPTISWSKNLFSILNLKT